MRQAFWGYFFLSMGIVILIIILLIQRLTTTDEEDFYLAREILQSSMIDAVDYGTFRLSGKIVISKEKLVEVFIRRFADSVTDKKTYEISFYNIIEDPPKATVRIRTNAGPSTISKKPVPEENETFDVSIDTIESGILETIYSKNR